MPDKLPKIPKEFARRVTRCIVDSLIEQGSIDPRGKTEEQIFKEVWEINKTAEWALVTDHTKSWLERARQAAEENDLTSSVVFYAIWAEHQINKMVESLGRRRKLSDELIESLIFRTSLIEKFIWLQLVLTSKKPSDKTIKKLQRLNKFRNDYIHYKWKPKKDTEKDQLKNVVSDAEKLIVELRAFLNLHFFHNQKKRVASLFSKRARRKLKA
ncbi:MAG TPA: hypothetical protein VL863_00795 [bacterium]|jgi:hypothetical protein|nr:hypothetical protein [bacterium]